jgi:hypothetical protein
MILCQGFVDTAAKVPVTDIEPAGTQSPLPLLSIAITITIAITFSVMASRSGCVR